MPTDNEGNPVLGTIAEQTQLCLKRIEAILVAANSASSRVLKVTIFVTDIKDWTAVNAICASFFGEHRLARIVVPSGQLNYGCSVEIFCIAAECE